MDNEDQFARMDFTLSELSSSAPWVRDALAQNERKRHQGDRSEFLKKLQAPAGRSNGAEQHPSVATTSSPAEQQKDLGNAAFKRGDWKQAIDLYSAAIKLDNTLLPAYNNRALAYLKIQRYAEALADSAVLLEREPSNVKALLRHAAAAEALGDVSTAESDLNKVLEIEPNNKEAPSKLQAVASRRQQQQSQLPQNDSSM